MAGSEPFKAIVSRQRLRLQMRGVVQGVGFRPLIHRLARELGLSGWVSNSVDGVELEIEGEDGQLDRFIPLLRQRLPETARIDSIDATDLVPLADSKFSIRGSTVGSHPAATIPHDLAPCSDCLREFHDPHNYRFHYPFISCTTCGPRWSIVRSLPFDRHNTSLKYFPLCPRCEREYNDSHQRRHHHQGISCPECGPTLYLTDSRGSTLAEGQSALQSAAAALARGHIIALKSVGGFQLLADALNPEAIARLRQRKCRPAKPLAVMFSDIEQLSTYGHAEESERQVLNSSARPIVLLADKGRLPPEIAPAIDTVGAMLPPSALHEALFTVCSTPLVATSGNRSGDPLCYDNRGALHSLAGIADQFLMHDLAIHHPLDDSVVRTIDDRPVTFRAGRGLAPFMLNNTLDKRQTLLALGGHQKNSVAITTPLGGILAGAHIGDLGSLSMQQRLAESVERYREFSHSDTITAITDLHPDYGSSQWAADNNFTQSKVQHHVAHFFSVMAEHGHRGPALGVCWDGTGLGDDGTLWGGEFFIWDGETEVRRIAHLRPFSLPGGEAAIREPRRQALGLLAEAGLSAPTDFRRAFEDSEWHNLQLMLSKNLNAPGCSSTGRLIDAVASLLRITDDNRFEADAAIQLESLAAQTQDRQSVLPFATNTIGDRTVIDWQPLIEALLVHQQTHHPIADLAGTFLNTLAAIIAKVVEDHDNLPVFLSGGVFQNRYLTERTLTLLRSNGKSVFTHGSVPPNDGGLAVGQLYYSAVTQQKPPQPESP